MAGSDHNYGLAKSDPGSPVRGEIRREGGPSQTARFLSFEMNFLRNFDTLGRTTTKQ